MKIQALYDALDHRISASLSCPWDNDGMSVCADPTASVTGIVVALDLTHEVIKKAEETGSNVILTHHPLLFKGVKDIISEPTAPVSSKIVALIQKGISAMAFHTRLDTLDGGVNDILASLLGLENIQAFGNNDNPQGKAMGRIGALPYPVSAKELALLAKQRLSAPVVTFTDCAKPISRVAVLGGSGGDELYAAIAAGADALVTGEAKHHHSCDAAEVGISLIAAGHDSTEFPICSLLALMAGEICHEAEEEIPVFVVRTSVVQGV